MSSTVDHGNATTTRGVHKLRALIVGALAAFALLFSVSSPAVAGTFSETSSGSDYDRTTTLYYKNPHGNFNITVWVTVDSCCFISDRYSIYMYNNAGTLLWSAGNQAARTYGIGGNVTKIVVTRNSTYGATTRWQR
jgi:hypothetical protein